VYLSDLELIRCPYCEERLEVEENYSDSPDELDFAIVKCSCSRFPISNGILNFGGKWRLGINEAISFLKKKQFNKACFVQMEMESLPLKNPFRILRKLSSRNIPLSKKLMFSYRNRKSRHVLNTQTFDDSLDAVGKDSFNQYLKKRFTLPSFYKAMPLLILVRELYPEVILDLGCGAGHYSFVLNKLCPGSKLISVDQHYTYLYLAKRFITPKPTFICLDITNKPPLAKSAIDVIFCSDMLKSQIKRQLVLDNYRCSLSPDGYFIGPRLDENWLSVSQLFEMKEWFHLFKNFKHTIFSEDCIMKAFFEKDAVSFQNVQIKDNQCDGFRSTYFVASKERETNNFKVKNISEIFSNALFSWALRSQYGEKSKEDSEVFFDFEGQEPPFSAHAQEWHSFIQNILPKEISVHESAFDEKNYTIQNDYKSLPDLIRKGVAVIKIDETDNRE